MKDIKFMSYRGHAIWKNEMSYMVAKGDRTDRYFTNFEDAMDWIDEIENAKNTRKVGIKK